MSTGNSQEPQQTPPAPLETPPVSTVTVIAEAPETPQETAPETVAEIPPEIVAELEATIVDTVVTVAGPAIENVAEETAQNSNDLLQVMQWQTEAQAILEGQTAAIQSMSEMMVAMGETLTALQTTGNREAQTTPSNSSSPAGDDTETTAPVKSAQQNPAEQPAPDNKPEKAEAKKQRVWM